MSEKTTTRRRFRINRVAGESPHDQRFIERRMRAHTRRDDATGCLVWTGGASPKGYGYINIGGTQSLAHRVALQLTGVAIPEGMVVMHTCDNPPCVNPDHLRVGTYRENTLDAKRKGRLKPYGFKRMLGVSNGAAKLTEQDVRAIRSLAEQRVKQVEIARRFGVSATTIRTVVTRKRYAEVA